MRYHGEYEVRRTSHFIMGLVFAVGYMAGVVTTLVSLILMGLHT